MSFHGTPAYPRNTSNGDYGRFHFAAGNRDDSSRQYSTNQNGIVEHVHYPNCPNNRQTATNLQQGTSQGQAPGNGNENGMPEYTIEYGEDAVRAALGGNMPDFQAQFQKQYGNAGVGGGDSFQVSPEQMQMVNGGKSKVAMLPVILTSDDQGDAQSQEQSFQTQGQDTAVEEQSQTAEVMQGQVENQKPPKPVNVLNAMDSVRRSRSTGPVKYGRHIRPSYWNPQAPNPCRKKLGFGGDGANEDNVPETNQTPPQSDMLEAPGSHSSHAYYNPQFNGNQNGYANQAPMPPAQSSQEQISTQPIPRSRSLPPKKPTASASLCGKCQKCKNLNSGNGQAPILTFPKYSSEGQGNLTRHQKLNTSSNLGQSAKNFRAIRFSSNQNRSFNI